MLSKPCGIFVVAVFLVTAPVLAGDLVVDGKLISTAANGAPLQVASDALVVDLNADMVDGLHASDLAKKLGNVLTVSSSGGDYLSPAAAMGAITDAGAGNPYLVLVGPGIYGSVTVKPYVHLVGAGEGATILSTNNGFTTTVVLGTNSSLRDVTVRHGFPEFFNLSRGLAVGTGAVGVEVRHVTVTTVGADGAHEAVRVVNGGSARFHDVTIHAAGGNANGLVLDGGVVHLQDVTIGVTSDGGDNRGIRVINASSLTLDGGLVMVTGNGAGTQNWGLYASGTTAAGTPIVFVDRASFVSSGTSASNQGIRSLGSVVALTDSSISVGDGGSGLSQTGGADKITRVTVRGSSIRVTGGASQVGIQNSIGSGSETVTVFDSQIEAATNIVSTASSWTTRLIRSHLAGGGMTGGGTVECRYSTDENFAGFTSTCP